MHLPVNLKFKRNPCLKDTLVNDVHSYIHFLQKAKIIRKVIIYTYTPLAVKGLLKIANTDLNISCIATPTLIDPEKAMSVRPTKKKWYFYTITLKQ